MKIRIYFLLLWPGVLWPNLAVSGDLGRGKLYMRGSIIETACNIDMSSRNQILNFEYLTISDLTKNIRSTISIPFEINFVDCSLEKKYPKKKNWKNFKITFDGGGGDNLFINYGTAKGISASIYNQNFDEYTPEKSDASYSIKPGKMSVRYYLVIENNNEKLVPGNIFFSVKYKVDYF